MTAAGPDGDSGALISALLRECERRLFDEGHARLLKCVGLLDDTQLWYRPHEGANSAGNLILHLEGNVRQWILTGLGRAPDSRKRATEFSEQGPLPRVVILQRLALTLEAARKVIRGLSPEALTAMHRVQGFEESGVAILVHVVEHFSYHVGQLTYIVKALTAVDTGYYQGVDLERKG